jgi:hypothetical protein
VVLGLQISLAVVHGESSFRLLVENVIVIQALAIYGNVSCEIKLPQTAAQENAHFRISYPALISHTSGLSSLRADLI